MEVDEEGEPVGDIDAANAASNGTGTGGDVSNLQKLAYYTIGFGASSTLPMSMLTASVRWRHRPVYLFPASASSALSLSVSQLCLNSLSLSLSLRPSLSFSWPFTRSLRCCPRPILMLSFLSLNTLGAAAGVGACIRSRGWGWTDGRGGRRMRRMRRKGGEWNAASMPSFPACRLWCVARVC